MLEHFGCYAEIGDNAVGQRTQRHDGPRRAPYHFAGKIAHRKHLVRADIHGYNGRFAYDDSLALDKDKRVDRAEIDSYILRKKRHIVLTLPFCF